MRTTTLTVPAACGGVTKTSVVEATLATGADTPPNVTVVPETKLLPVMVTVWGVGLSLLMWSVEADLPIAVAYALAAVAGAGLPAIGSSVRARWAHVLDAPRDVQTAFALEAVADEVVFMTGPIIVTVLATAVHPVAGLGAALAAGVLGTLYFSAQRATAPPPHPRPTTRAARAPVLFPENTCSAAEVGPPRQAVPWRGIAQATSMASSLSMQAFHP